MPLSHVAQYADNSGGAVISSSIFTGYGTYACRSLGGTVRTECECARKQQEADATYVRPPPLPSTFYLIIAANRSRLNWNLPA